MVKTISRMSKYDFRGIKALGAKSLLLALSSNPYFIWLERFKLTGILEILLEWLVNYLANQGLILLNLGAIYVEGHFDQKAFDAHMEEALQKVEIGRGRLTIEQVKEIDDAVIKAARKFLVWNK